MDSNMWNIVLMVIIGAIAGTLASRIVKGSNFGFVVNAILGIAGAVVGGFIFKALKLSPGQGITKMISEQFSVNLPSDFIGSLVSALVGSIAILIIFGLFKKKN